MTETPTTFGNRIIIRMPDTQCRTAHDILKSPLAARVVQRFLDHLARHDAPLLAAVRELSPRAEADGMSPAAEAVVELLRLLVDFRPPVIREMVPTLAPLVETTQPLADFVDKLYDFWREYERFLIYEGAADASRDRAIEGHLPFVRANDDLKNLVLEVYRRVDSNLRGCWPRVYHQVPAGASVGLLVDAIDWNCPYPALADVPLVRLALLELPVALSPRRGALGAVTAAARNPLDGAVFAGAWYDLPLSVGPLVVHVVFHEDDLGQAAGLINLYEIAGHADARRAPDGIVCFGLPGETVLYADAAEPVIGTVARGGAADSFDGLAAMILAVHDAAARRRGWLPVRGAMATVALTDGSAANVLLLGDGGAAVLEGLRALAHPRLREMTVRFSDAGALEATPDGALARGTAVGACAPPQALPPGWALGQFDRGIVLNPLSADARVVIPVTTLDVVTAGARVDVCLAMQPDAPPAIVLVDDASPLGDGAAAATVARALRASGAVIGRLGAADPDVAARTLYAWLTGEPT